MTTSFSPEFIDQEIGLETLHSIAGGLFPLAPLVPVVTKVAIGTGIAAGLLYGSKKVLEGLDAVTQNLDRKCDGGNSDCSGPNKLSYSDFPEDVDDPFGGAITGKQ